MFKMRKPQDLLNLHRNQKGWYTIRNHAGHDGDAAQIHIYGYIGWDVTAGDFINELGGVTADAIDVHIATNGGDVFDGIAITNALRSHGAAITTINDAQALSAGSFIMQAGDTRVMMPNSTMMIHDASMGFAYAEGNAEDMRRFAEEVVKMATLLDKTSDNIASMYAERAGGTVADWRSVMQAETWYDPAEAVTAGLADKVYTKSTTEDAHRKIPTAVVNPPAPIEVPVFDAEAFARIIREAVHA
jgi:ATP-dependent protease ClpP protease subunit